jgi:hypothetical protein
MEEFSSVPAEVVDIFGVKYVLYDKLVSFVRIILSSTKCSHFENIWKFRPAREIRLKSQSSLGRMGQNHL